MTTTIDKIAKLMRHDFEQDLWRCEVEGFATIIYNKNNEIILFSPTLHPDLAQKLCDMYNAVPFLLELANTVFETIHVTIKEVCDKSMLEKYIVYALFSNNPMPVCQIKWIDSDNYELHHVNSITRIKAKGTQKLYLVPKDEIQEKKHG